MLLKMKKKINSFGGFFIIYDLQSGHTALQRASAEGHVDIIKQLIKQGASVDHQDEVVSAILISFQRFFSFFL